MQARETCSRESLVLGCHRRTPYSQTYFQGLGIRVCGTNSIVIVTYREVFFILIIEPAKSLLYFESLNPIGFCHSRAARSEGPAGSALQH